MSKIIPMLEGTASQLGDLKFYAENLLFDMDPMSSVTNLGENIHDFAGAIKDRKLGLIGEKVDVVKGKMKDLSSDIDGKFFDAYSALSDSKFLKNIQNNDLFSLAAADKLFDKSMSLSFGKAGHGPFHGIDFDAMNFGRGEEFEYPIKGQANSAMAPCIYGPCIHAQGTDAVNEVLDKKEQVLDKKEQTKEKILEKKNEIKDKLKDLMSFDKFLGNEKDHHHRRLRADEVKEEVKDQVKDKKKMYFSDYEWPEFIYRNAFTGERDMDYILDNLAKILVQKELEVNVSKDVDVAVDKDMYGLGLHADVVPGSPYDQAHKPAIHYFPSSELLRYWRSSPLTRTPVPMHAYPPMQG